MNSERFQELFEKRAKTYEHLGKEHNSIAIDKEYSGNDISAHLHCEVVELWLTIKLNQSIEQIVDELADILCILSLALVLYEDASGDKISFDKILEKAEEQIKNREVLNLIADSKKEWNIDVGLDSKQHSIIKCADDFIKMHDIEIAYNFGKGINVDIFGMLHHSINEFWNAVRKNKSGYSQIFKELTKIFAIWIISVRLISQYLNTDISIDNLIEISKTIFTNVAKKKFNIDI